MTPTQFYHATEQARGVAAARAAVRARMVEVTDLTAALVCGICTTWCPPSREFGGVTFYDDYELGLTVCEDCLEEYVAEEADNIVCHAASGRLLDGVEHLESPAGVVLK